MNSIVEKLKNETKIKIFRTPEGEAPEWVRCAWVGLELPCESHVGINDTDERGAVSGEKTTYNRYGYSVPQKEALEILADHNLEAANWWKEHGYPKISGDKKYFCFSEFEVMEVSGIFTRQRFYVVTE